MKRAKMRPMMAWVVVNEDGEVWGGWPSERWGGSWPDLNSTRALARVTASQIRGASIARVRITEVTK